MNRAHPFFRIGGLMAALLLLALIPGIGAWADDPPSGVLIPPVSLEGAFLLPSYTGCGGVPGVPSSNMAYEQEVVERVNAARADNGLSPLKRVSLLDDAARYHATDLAQDDYFNHDSYDRSRGSLIYVCGWSARVQSYYPSPYAENIAAGYTTPESVMNGWMNSSGHRANILSTSNWEIGVGYYQGGGYYYRYWVQDFGRRNNVYPLVVNREAAQTDSRHVSLYIYGNWQEMRLRNDSGDWTAWQPFQAALSWTLNVGVGEHAVGAEMRSGGTTAASSDTIYLTKSPALGNLPGAVHFTYSIPDQELLPAAHRITPLNVGNSELVTWTLSIGGDRFTAGPLDGVTPASFWITPTTFSTDTIAAYTGAVTVTVVDPAGTLGSPQRIDVTLQVTTTPLSRVYLALVARNYAPPLPLVRYSNDPYYNRQWALAKIEAPAAWGISTGRGALIAVIDSGADLDHPDLAGKVRSDIDWDYVNGDDVADDDNGHGSHVSGIAGAATDNATGVAGLGWEAMLLPLKVLDASGSGYSDDLAAAIRYAADHGADVINMSLGGAAPCPFDVQEAVDYAHARGVVLVAAAGNYQGRTEDFPANCAHVLGVSATNSDDSFASYSNYGNHVSVAAPGTSIYSTLPGGAYGTMGGTSMASPHVAGLAALLHARYPAYTPDQIASAILDNALDLGAAGWDERYGCGRINAFQALYTGARGDSPLCLAGVGDWAAEAGAGDAPFAPGEIIVSFRAGIAAQATSQEVAAGAEFLPAIGAWRLRVTPGQEQAILARLLADPAVAYAELNYLVSAR
jgi:subtilisin family serine protease/uncharacterized protein YkwD